MSKEINVVTNLGPMLNAYPDSMGENLRDIVDFLQREELKDAFTSFYILPSVFNTDLDRGFSVIDYQLNKELASSDNLDALKKLGIDLKFDFILNHASVLSPQFQDILKNGENSIYKDFFINWNLFWDGCGTMTEEGYIQPNEELIAEMFFRKSGLPILMVGMPDGTKVPYWNTFYQEIQYPHLDAQDIMKLVPIQYYAAQKLADRINKALIAGEKLAQLTFGQYEEYRKKISLFLESNIKYLGQMDLNIKSPLVWDFYENTLKTLAAYGAKIVRLDAFAYAPKEPGEKNFLNDPGTWELLEKVKKLADQYKLTLLPEIHASYEEGIYEKLSEKGYMTYDFFLPGLVIDAIESCSGTRLASWANELIEKKIQVTNMLGCHDGIPLLDLKGILDQERIENLMDIIVKRNGYVKNLHGQKNIYYQVNATYYSALGEDDNRMLLARAIQMFMPGKPQVWYLDLFAGKNDLEGMKRAGANGHKEINRTNLTVEQIGKKMDQNVVKQQLNMLRFRATFAAFSADALITVSSAANQMEFIWEKEDNKACLKIDFEATTFEMTGIDGLGTQVFLLSNV